MQNGVPDPVDYVLTTVARLVDQDGAPFARIAEVQTRLKAVAGRQFLYPLESMHISLLGCTQRYPTRGAFTPERIEAVRKVCSQIISGRGAAVMILRGIGIIGNQVFIQVLPHDRLWAQLRQELGDALVDIGENPITYANKNPIHLNIMRIADAELRKIADILTLVEELRNIDLGDVMFTNVTFMITDFVLAPDNTESLDTFRLA